VLAPTRGVVVTAATPERVELELTDV